MGSVAEIFNPFCDPTLNDPESVLSRARADEPVFFSPFLQSWIVTRYGDITAVLRDPEVFSSRNVLDPNIGVAPEVDAVLDGSVPAGGTLVGLDPPEHTRLRKVLATAFQPSRIGALADRIHGVATALIDGFVADGSVDLLERFAFPLPLKVVIHLMGIPDEDVTLCMSLCESATNLPMAEARGIRVAEQLRMAEAYVELHQYLLDLIEQRERQPREDLISDLIAMREEGDEELSNWELLSLLPGLVFAGHETTANLISNLVWQLLRDRARWERVRVDRNVVERAVEETLRHDCPVLGMPRVTTKDTTIDGTAIPADSRVLLVFSSANHDEAHYDHPDGFDLDRAGAAPHLAFGRGIHYCLGAQLGRLEAQIALNALMDRLPDLHLLTTDVGYFPHYFLRRRERLPVAWTIPTADQLEARR